MLWFRSWCDSYTRISDRSCYAYLYFKIFIYDWVRGWSVLSASLQTTPCWVGGTTKGSGQTGSMGKGHRWDSIRSCVGSCTWVTRIPCRFAEWGWFSECLEICLEEKSPIVLVNSSCTWAGVCPGGKRRTMGILACIRNCGQQDQESDPPVALGIGEAVPRILCSGLGSSLWERLQLISSAHSRNEGLAPFIFEQAGV